MRMSLIKEALRLLYSENLWLINIASQSTDKGQ